jgi:peptide/nickel transport system substrate-binding protein
MKPDRRIRRGEETMTLALATLRTGAALAASLALASPMTAEAADPRTELVVAVNELARSLDPGAQTGNVDVRIYYSIFDNLIRRDFVNPAENGGAKLVPALATAWRWVDPTTLEVDLRRGVTCHDGSPFNAADVLATFSPERLWGPESFYPDGRNYFSSLKAVEKVDDFKVRFVTAEPDPAFDQRLSSYTGFIICDEPWNRFRREGVSHKVWMEEAAAALRWKPVGTGPYRFAEYQKNDRIRLTAFDAYFEGKPAARTVTFKEVPEVAARVAGLVSGDYHIVVDLPPDQWDVVKGYPDLAVKTAAIENTHVVLFNMSDPVLGDKKLRQALSYAIDRAALNEALWKGQAVTPNGFQLPSFGAVYEKARAGYAYDLEKAKRLVAESGYKGQEISYRLIPNYYTYNVEAAQILQEMWAKIGVRVRIDFVESFKDVRRPGAQMFAWSNTYRIPDPTGSFLVLWGPTSDTQAQHKYFKAPAEFNDLSRRLGTTLAEGERKAMYQRMLDLFEDEMPMTMLYNPVAAYGMKKDVRWNPYVQFYMDFRASNLSIGSRS